MSPWGSPPPSSPYSGPPTPIYNPPGNGGGGWNGGVPPYGQPPKRRRTGLIVGIVGIVALVVLVVAALVVTLVVTGGDDDPDEASSSAPTSQATSEATEDPTSTESSDATEPTETSEPTDEGSDGPAPAPGDLITGDGYTYALPAAGWKDATEDAKELAGTIDTAIILGASIDLSQSSIIVEALPGGAASSLDDLEGLWKRNLAASDGATPVDIDDIEIDGERAIGVRIEDRVNNGGVPIVQVAYLALHDGGQYSIGLSFPKRGDEVSEDDFQTMLDSWSWSS